MDSWIGGSLIAIGVADLILFGFGGGALMAILAGAYMAGKKKRLNAPLVIR
jgi:hypothetical protein